MFIHYVPELTVDAKGQKPSIDELVDRFDARQIAKDAADFGVEYVIFTAWHFRTCTLYPSAVNKKWRDDKRNPSIKDSKSTKTYSERDLIDQLSTELSQQNIDLHLYVHPVDGHDYSKEDQQLTGWDRCDNDHEIWNQYQNELFDELGQRYGQRIKGYWFDGFFNHHNFGSHPCIQQSRLKTTMLKHNPDMVLLANVGDQRQRPLYPEWTAADYRSWECGGAATGNYSLVGVYPHVRQDDTRTWPCTKEQVAMIVGANWWAVQPSAKAKSDPINLYRYLVLQASISTGGGFAIAAGCFPDKASQNPNGTLWEGNFHSVMTGLHELVKPVAASVKNTNAGKAFVTPERQRLEQMDWGVSTESPDGNVVYLHILRPPVGQILLLGHTEDGSTLGGPARILKTGQIINFTKKLLGYEISLPAGVQWDALDTVIQVQRLPK